MILFHTCSYLEPRALLIELNVEANALNECEPRILIATQLILSSVNETMTRRRRDFVENDVFRAPSFESDERRVGKNNTTHQV
jgi:hypothetical protein